jgi:hypothetical protein
VVRELVHQVERYQVLSVAFADNVLPAKQAVAIFDGIHERRMDLSIFTELRAIPSVDLIRSMHLAGVDTVQVGIEALSARLLAKMNKGVRVIDNLCMMKLCEAAGIRNASNLMLHFPGSDETDVAETLHTLAFVCWYRPLKAVSFWLGVDSPVHRHARHFNICSTYNHPNLKKLFPEPLATELPFMIRGYRGDRGRQQQLWRPVAKAIRQWRKDYDTMQRRAGGGPALFYRDAGHFLIIDQYDPQQPIAKHRLTGISAEIYRFCYVPQRLEQILATFTSHNSQQILAFLTAMVDKRLMFEQAHDYLSLASPLTWPGRP